MFAVTAATELYTLSLHDALPISPDRRTPRGSGRLSPRSRRGPHCGGRRSRDRKSTRLNSSHVEISYAVFCLKKKNIAVLHDKGHVVAKTQQALEQLGYETTEGII